MILISYLTAWAIFLNLTKFLILYNRQAKTQNKYNCEITQP